MFSSRFTIILLFALFIPLVLRFLKAEPYPAVLLPANASVIKKSDGLTIMNTRLFGITRDGSWTEIDKRFFFDPLPLEYAGTALSRHLQLDGQLPSPGARKTAIYRRLGISRQQTLSTADLRQLKDWVKMKLDGMGCSPVKIRISDYREIIAIRSGLVVHKELLNEKIYALD